MHNLTNKDFGYWHVIKPVSQGANKPLKWLCKCTLCGEEHLVASSSLIKGVSTMCRSCSLKKMGASRKIWRNDRLKCIYKAMLQRCYNPNNSSYKNYGAKGVTVCDEWRNNSSSFQKWAFANGYNDSLTIDRIDNHKGYSPENCRWVSQTKQNQNRSSLHYATINGETKCVTEWCRELKLTPSTIIMRINKGMSPEEALSQPINKNMARK